jgi:predicted lipoprotein with Yx(FWY)xxD motif
MAADRHRRPGQETMTMNGSFVTRLPMGVKLGVPLGAALLAAACGSASGASSAPASSAPANSASATTIETRGGPAGTFLTDGAGRTVYLFAKDGMNSSSSCSGACAAAWPPVTASGKVAVSGSAKASDLGAIIRSDGARQVTYHGHPLYYFQGDSAAGQANGQGIDNFGAKWWLVAPSGSQITSAAAGSGARAPASTPATSNPGGGWG